MDSTAQTLAHIALVQSLLARMADTLIDRGRVHDASKLEEPEKSGYDTLIAKMPGVVYGTPEYHAILAECRPAVEGHVCDPRNRHHPEACGGIASMSLLDLIEMLCDWKASALERGARDGVVRLDLQAQRFGISGDLLEVLRNTLDCL